MTLGKPIKLRDAINFLLHAMEVGEIDWRGKFILFQGSSVATEPTLAGDLVLRTLKLGSRYLQRKYGWTLDRELTDQELVDLHDLLIVALKHVRLPYQVTRDEMYICRREALVLIGQAIATHHELGRMIELRSVPFTFKRRRKRRKRVYRV